MERFRLLAVVLACLSLPLFKAGGALAGGVELVSVSSEGVEGNDLSALPSISADGRYVAFESEADNLVESDNNGYRDIFVQDTQTGQTTRVSVNVRTGLEGNADCDQAFHLLQRALPGLHVRRRQSRARRYE